MDTRKNALKWWKLLSYPDKVSALRNCKDVIGFDERTPESLTGREIEIIYRKIN